MPRGGSGGGGCFIDIARRLRRCGGGGRRVGRRGRRGRRRSSAKLELTAFGLELLPATPSHQQSTDDAQQPAEEEAAQGSKVWEPRQEGQHRADPRRTADDDHQAALGAGQVRGGRELWQEDDQQHGEPGDHTVGPGPEADERSDDGQPGAEGSHLFVRVELTEIHTLAALLRTFGLQRLPDGQAVRDRNTRANESDGEWWRWGRIELPVQNTVAENFLQVFPANLRFALRTPDRRGASLAIR